MVESIYATLDGYCHNIKDFSLGFQNWCKNGQQLHGLWPNPDCDCRNEEKFDTKKIDSLTLSFMNKHWNACGQANRDLWSHEWNKHGKCSGLTQAEFFSVTVKLFMKLKGTCRDTCKIKVPTTTVKSTLAEFYKNDDDDDDNFDASAEDKKSTTVGTMSQISFELFRAFLVFAVFGCCGILGKSLLPHAQDPFIGQVEIINRDVEEQSGIPLMTSDFNNPNMRESPLA